jgi:flavoprotein
VSSTSITAVVPVGAISGNITVTNIHGTGAINGFTATPPPNISYNSPGVYTVGSAITPLAPINTGSQIPVKTYGEVTAFAGNGLSGSENGILTSSSFKFPYATALDAQGNMYVADAGNNLIRKITKDGVVSTFAGSGLASFADGSGTSAGFNNPWGLAVDLAGNVYVADAGNNRVRKISTAGVVTTIAGSGISGSFNGIGTAASFSKPQGVALDRYGNILVADGLSNKIRKITPAGQVSTFAGNGSQGSVNGYTSTASFYNPTGIVVDTSGIVYITDQNNHKIRIVLPNSPENIVLNMAGTGISGSANGTGISASFASPTGITLDNYGNILVADAANNTIRKITSTNVVSTLAGSGLVSAVNGIGIGASFSRPTGITSDGQGTLYVADQNNHQIRKINL